MAIKSTTSKPTQGSYTSATTSVDEFDAEATEHHGDVLSATRGGFATQVSTQNLNDPADRPETFLAERWGLVKHLSTIDAVRHFRDQIGGRL